MAEALAGMEKDPKRIETAGQAEALIRQAFDRLNKAIEILRSEAAEALIGALSDSLGIEL